MKKEESKIKIDNGNMISSATQIDEIDLNNS